MVFLAIESANKAEINILSARDTTRPRPQARASWVMVQYYITGVQYVVSIITNRPPLANDKFY